MLNEFRSTYITWDKATRRIYSPITANESDENGRKLVVQIVNGGQVEDLTGTALHLYWETRDKAHDGLDVFKAVDLKKGKFELSYTTGMLSNHGVLNANLVLIDTVGRVVSERFKITVTEGIDNDAIQSENSFSSLTQALIDISNLEQNYAPRLNDLTAQLQQTMVLVDDIENLQTIVNNAPDYSTILFPKGASFTMDTDIIMKGKLSLVGNGCEINGKGRFRFYGVNDVNIHGFRFVDTVGNGTIYTPLLFNPSPDHDGLNDNIKIYDNVFDGCELWLKSYKVEHSNNDVHIFNNRFIGNQSLKTIAGNGCIFLSNGKNSKIYDNYFDTIGGYRYIKLTAGIGVEKIVNKDGVPHHSIIDEGYSENIEIRNNTMLGTLRKTLTSTYAKQPIDLFNGASNILIKDNTIKVNVDSTVPLEHVIDGKEYGPSPFENYTNKVKDITIEGNHIEGNFYNAIFLGNLYGQAVVKDHLGNVYDDNDSRVTISNNKIITTTTNMTFTTEMIKVTGHKTVNIENNTLKMNRGMTGLIKAIWVLSCGYTYINKNKILEQGRIYIDEPYNIQGIYGSEGGRRRKSMKYVEIEGNTIEWLGVRAIVFGQVNTFINYPDSEIDTTLIIKNNYFNNLDTITRSLPLSTSGRYKQLKVEGNSYRTDGSDALTYPNYTNMSVGYVVDKDNAWTNIPTLPTSGTFNQGHILYKLNTVEFLGWVCTQKGTFGSLNGNRTIGTILSNSNELVVDSVAGLAVGQYLTVEGFEGIHRVIAINNNSVYLDSASDVTLTDAKVLFSQPVFKTYGGITV